MLPGRVRVYVPGWSGKGKHTIETGLRLIEGVRRVQANPVTGTVLIEFDPTLTDVQIILHEVRTLDLEAINALDKDPPPPPVQTEKRGRIVRARIAVRGLDRDPQLAKLVVERLACRPGVVQVKVNWLTGRVLVEFFEHKEDVDDLLAEVVGLELPDRPEEDRPSHPLDPGPLLQSTQRTIGAALGLSLLAIRRLVGMQEPLPGSGVALEVASVISIVQGIPPVRYGLRRLFGRTGADLLVHVPGILSLTLAGSPLGLTFTVAESVRLLTEAHARRTAWLRRKERSAHAPSAQPDAVIHLQTDERPPLAARVLSGTGTAIGRDGMPLPVVEGGTVPPGARLYGGPFVLQLQNEQTFQPFIPQSRPTSIAPSFYDRYLQASSLLSLASAAVTVLFTGSLTQTLISLLLVNSRTAAIGLDSADLNAAARVLRAGVTVVGTRPHRPIRLPGFLLLVGVRLLSDTLELASALPLSKHDSSAAIQAQAAAIAAAAGSPWGGAFRATSQVAATDGAFDGQTATACIERVRYWLGPVEDWSRLPEAADLRQRGQYVLLLRSEREEKSLGLFALQPQLAPGVADLVQTCRRHGVELAVLASGDQLAVRALAQRAHIGVLESHDAVSAIDAKQQQGAIVAFVSDNAGAAAGFDACDLAIGLIEEHNHLPARADLLAPDLSAVAALIEAGARRDAAVRDAVGLSTLSNIIGVVWGWRGLPGIEVAVRAVYLTALVSLADAWVRLQGGRHPDV
jgi:cation transport ATPase